MSEPQAASRTEWTIRSALPSDRDALARLLEECRLPSAGAWDPQTRVWVAEVEGAVVGAAGLEGYDAVALLRSVATRPEWRGRGVAGALCREVLSTASREGVKSVFLLTETAESFFQRLGFECVPRGLADTRLLASAEFQGNTCSSATLMKREMSRA